jgi:hypothetical protein
LEEIGRDFDIEGIDVLFDSCLLIKRDFLGGKQGGDHLCGEVDFE